MPNQVKKSTSTRRSVTKTQTPASFPPQQTQDSATNSILNRLSQQFNLLAILIIALFLFQSYTFYKLKDVEKNGSAAGTAGGPAAQQASPLEEKKLIAYAEEIGLNKGDFEKCLKSDEPKNIVKADTQEANDLQVFGTPGFFVNGKFLGGAFPFEYFKEIIDKEIDGTATGQCTDYSEELQGACSDPQQRNFVPQPVEVKIGNAPIKGKADAKVTIVEFSDFECPFCIRAYPTVKQIMDTYPNDVKFYYKQLPLTSLHPNAQKAAEASVCAQKQGKFWEFHDKLFSVQAQG
jgi:protein-disulfide isomerase